LDAFVKSLEKDGITVALRNAEAATEQGRNLRAKVCIVA
jgi:hypothetical protein